MKLNTFVLTLAAVALLPNFAHAGPDEVAACFERDLYREPINSAATITGETDPLVYLFNIALSAEVSKPVKQIAISGNHHHGS